MVEKEMSISIISKTLRINELYEMSFSKSLMSFLVEARAVVIFEILCTNKMKQNKGLSKSSRSRQFARLYFDPRVWTRRESLVSKYVCDSAGHSISPHVSADCIKP